eukprot:358262-Chlamydomonas_euryale.AAC.7
MPREPPICVALALEPAGEPSCCFCRTSEPRFFAALAFLAAFAFALVLFAAVDPAAEFGAAVLEAGAFAPPAACAAVPSSAANAATALAAPVLAAARVPPQPPCTARGGRGSWPAAWTPTCGAGAKARPAADAASPPLARSAVALRSPISTAGALAPPVSPQCSPRRGPCKAPSAAASTPPPVRRPLHHLLALSYCCCCCCDRSSPCCMCCGCVGAGITATACVDECHPGPGPILRGGCPAVLPG